MGKKKKKPSKDSPIKHDPPSICQFACLWGVVGGIVFFLAGTAVAFMTVGNPYIADGFYVVSIILLAWKFLSWEIAKHHNKAKKIKLITILGSIIVLIIIVVCNHTYYRYNFSSSSTSNQATQEIIGEEKQFTANIRNWLGELKYSIQEIPNEEAFFLFNATSADKKTIVMIGWPRRHKDIILFNVIMKASPRLKNDFDKMNNEMREKILSKIKVELIKMHIGFRDLTPADEVILWKAIPITEFTNKTVLREGINEIKGATQLYSQMLIADVVAERGKALSKQPAISIDKSENIDIRQNVFEGYDTAIEMKRSKNINVQENIIKK